MNYLLIILFIILLYYYSTTTITLETFINNIENYRGIPNYKKYPPCYNLDNSVINIYDFFENKKLLNEAYLLLNIYRK